MAFKKTTTPVLRFRVERIGHDFVIVDSRDLKFIEFEPGTTRAEAEKQCDARNGVAQAKTSESPVHQKLREKFRTTGIRLDELGGGPRDRWLCQGNLTARAQRLLDNQKSWLPPMLREWANEVASQCGYGGARRRSWRTLLVMEVIQTEGMAFNFARGSTVASFHFAVWPSLPHSWEPESEIELREILCTHYLSADPAQIKAAHFEISEREYYRRLTSAHRGLARSWVVGNDPGSQAVYRDEMEIEATDDAEGYGDDDYAWAIDPEDLANFSW